MSLLFPSKTLLYINYCLKVFIMSIGKIIFFIFSSLGVPRDFLLSSLEISKSTSEKGLF